MDIAGVSHYVPPVLDVESKPIILQLTVNDFNILLARHDPSVTKQVTFSLNKRPCILDLFASAADPTTGAGFPLSPVASGAADADKVKVRFSANLGIFDGWTIENVSWTMISWTGAIVDQTDYLTSDPIPVDETHRRFTATVSVTWTSGGISHTDTKTKTFPLLFDKTGHDELIDTSRGWQVDQFPPMTGTPVNPPNWFDNRYLHWGHVISQMTSPYVYYMPSIPVPGRTEAPGTFDWAGDYVPGNPVSARGRIYVSDAAAAVGPGDVSDKSTRYGLRTFGIDHLAVETI